MVTIELENKEVKGLFEIGTNLFESEGENENVKLLRNINKQLLDKMGLVDYLHAISDSEQEQYQEQDQEQDQETQERDDIVNINGDDLKLFNKIQEDKNYKLTMEDLETMAKFYERNNMKQEATMAKIAIETRKLNGGQE